MTDRRVFTSGQWALALGIALALHLVLAWSLLSGLSKVSSEPAGREGRLGLEVLASGGAPAPLLRDLAADSPELAMVREAVPPSSVQQAVPPAEVRPMREAVPLERKPARTERARSETRPKKARTPENRSPARSPKDRPNRTAKGSESSDRANASGRTGKDPAKETYGGGDRSAAPAPGNPPPRYPSVARRLGQEGRVLIRVSVLGNGRVDSATVTGSSGHGVLDRAALKAVKRWRFQPALRGGKPVAATLVVPVTFRLEG